MFRYQILAVTHSEKYNNTKVQIKLVYLNIIQKTFKASSLFLNWSSITAIVRYLKKYKIKLLT